MLDQRQKQPATDRDTMSGQWQMLGFTPARVLRLYGMRRSGNHAIADWLQRNRPGQGTVFLNNCAPGKSPLEGFRMIEVNRIQGAARTAHRKLAKTCAPAGPDGMLLFSYEDTPPGVLRRGRAVSGDFDATTIDAEVVIYRSFLNWSASLLRKLQRNPEYSPTRRAAILLRAVDDYVQMLTALETPAITGICYDDWLERAAYRTERLRHLGLPERDNGLGQVQRYGGGSSFQDDATDPVQLDTARRAAQMADDPDHACFLDIASRDGALIAALTRHFPDDAAALAARGAA